MNLLIIMIRTTFFYFFIFFIYRIMGKREVGQLGIIDLIVSILIAELAVISIENFDDGILNSIVPIITLTGLQLILAYFTLKKPNFRKFLDGEPSIIVKDGKVNYQEMIKQKYNLEDLLVQIREKGFNSLEDVNHAILENNGSLSVFGHEKKKGSFPLPLIIDGTIYRKTIDYLKKDEIWIYNMLDKKKININEVFYAFYRDKDIYIIKNSDLL